MSNLKPRYNKPGTAPGLRALQVATDGAKLSLFDFDHDVVIHEHDVTLERCASFAASRRNTWVHVQGSPSLQLLHLLGETYNLHQLAIEDVVNSAHRSKLETFPDQLFCVLNMPGVADKDIQTTQVSLFLGASYVVSFCHGKIDPFKPIYDRINASPPGRIRSQGASFLFYALIDLIIDQGFPALDHLSDELEDLEDRVLDDPDPRSLQDIHHVKRNLIVLRKNLGPQREVVNAMIRDDHPLLNDSVRVYLRDCYDHAVQIRDLIESYRDMASGLQDLYLSSISNRMNEVMKVLTIIATIFIPLSFFAGLYGMNFNTEISPWNMPELNSRYGYPVFILFMVAIAAGLVAFFRHRKWL